LVDFPADAMNKNGLYTNAGEKKKKKKNCFLQVGVCHSGTAVFDNNAPSAKTLDVWKGFAKY
jgi:hypothetical protein